jgi:MacB-like periplasmic core domain/FtsX-like permease family
VIPRTRTSYRFVSSDYFNVLGIAITKGRAFTQDESTANAAVAIVSESTAREIWPHEEAVGQVLRLEPDDDPARQTERLPVLSSQTFLVVGTARDVAGLRIGEPEAGVFVPTSASTVKTSLIARVHGDPDVARRALLERLTPIDPNLGMVFTMRSLARLETYPLQAGFWLTVTLGALALVLTLSGIFGVLSFLVEQRAKEIGVRIAMGATTSNIVRLVLRQSLRLVGSGLVVGGLIAWAFATLIMASPVGTRFGTLVDVFDPLAYTTSVLCIAVACLLATTLPALRAARIDPYAILHRD